MIRLLLLMTIQSISLVMSQVFLKTALLRIPSIDISILRKITVIVFNVYTLFACLFLFVSGLIWLFVLQRYDFSVAYPLISISYVISTFVSYYYFKENINWLTILAILFIMVGVVLLTLSKKII